MEMLKLENVSFFIVLFLPGFISVKIYHLIVSEEKYDFSKNLLEIIGFSLLNLILNSWLILINIRFDWVFEDCWWFYLSSLWILILMPIGYPFLIKYLLNNHNFNPYFVSNIKSAWDYYFSKNQPAWVIIYLKDGRKVAGVYGSSSFASGYPNKESIYIQEVWNTDSNNAFINQLAQTDGALILSENIISIEFYK